MGDREGANGADGQQEIPAEQQAPASEEPPRRLPRIIELEPEEITRNDQGSEETRDRSQGMSSEG
jgi:hypothetical protein